jgi:hypothetical protein
MAEGAADVCVCVLLYGTDDACFQLAQRVLNAPMLQLARQNVEFRLGLNAVSDRTRAFVKETVASHLPGALVLDYGENIFKYPMMRRMFHERPLRAPLTMWFDDDSCLAPENNPAAWLPRAQKLMENYTMIGSLYRQRLVGKQAQWIQDQWWYNGKIPGPYVKFCTGGWWTIRTETLLRFDWPPPELKHRGGDVMLGALCEQHGLALTHFRDQVWINANDQGVESKSPRRGYNEKPIGVDYKTSAAPLSREVLVAQGSCCGNACVNCPYTPPHERGATTIRNAV